MKGEGEMKEYLLIQPSEDGEPCCFLDDVQELLNNPEDYGVEKFLSSIPDEDPNYWEEGCALLLKIKILKPKLKATSWRLE